MSFSVTLLLTVGKDTGPFNIYGCINGSCNDTLFTGITINNGIPFSLTGITEGTTSLKIESDNVDCSNSVIIPIQNIPLPTPTPTPTSELIPVTPTPTPTSELIPVTPTPTPTQETTEPEFTIFVSTYNGTCSPFCDGETNYNITSLKTSTADFFNIAPGDVIDDLPIAAGGFYAISNISTDTDTGPFKIVEVDSLGEVQSVLVCSGGTCTPE
jgi:hypothetical protein